MEDDDPEDRVRQRQLDPEPRIGHQLEASDFLPIMAARRGGVLVCGGGGEERKMRRIRFASTLSRL